MAPRGFDCYMVSHSAGRHPKFARLNDSERCAHFLGVLAIAGMSPVRGRLLVGRLPAEPVDIARAAGVTLKVAASAMQKLQDVGVLEFDEEHGCLRVHDWEDLNPTPGSSTERMRRHRRRQRDENVTPSVTRNVTETSQRASPEVEVEVEGTSSLRSDVHTCFAYWQERCDHGQAKLTADRRSKIQSRLREGFTVEEIKRAIDGAAKAPFINEQGRKFDDIELICRNGSKLEDFMARADARPCRAPSGTASPPPWFGTTSSRRLRSVTEMTPAAAERIAKIQERLAREHGGDAA